MIAISMTCNFTLLCSVQPLPLTLRVRVLIITARTHLLNARHGFIIRVNTQQGAPLIPALRPGERPTNLFLWVICPLMLTTQQKHACTLTHTLHGCSVDRFGLEHKLSEINTDHTTGRSLPPPVNIVNSRTQRTETGTCVCWHPLN